MFALFDINGPCCFLGAIVLCLHVTEQCVSCPTEAFFESLLRNHLSYWTKTFFGCSFIDGLQYCRERHSLLARWKLVCLVVEKCFLGVHLQMIYIVIQKYPLVASWQMACLVFIKTFIDGLLTDGMPCLTETSLDDLLTNGLPNIRHMPSLVAPWQILRLVLCISKWLCSKLFTLIFS